MALLQHAAVQQNQGDPLASSLGSIVGAAIGNSILPGVGGAIGGSLGGAAGKAATGGNVSGGEALGGAAVAGLQSDAGNELLEQSLSSFFNKGGYVPVGFSNEDWEKLSPQDKVKALQADSEMAIAAKTDYEPSLMGFLTHAPLADSNIRSPKEIVQAKMEAGKGGPLAAALLSKQLGTGAAVHKAHGGPVYLQGGGDAYAQAQSNAYKLLINQGLNHKQALAQASDIAKQSVALRQASRPQPQQQAPQPVQQAPLAQAAPTQQAQAPAEAPAEEQSWWEKAINTAFGKEAIEKSMDAVNKYNKRQNQQLDQLAEIDKQLYGKELDRAIGGKTVINEEGKKRFGFFNKGGMVEDLNNEMAKGFQHGPLASVEYKKSGGKVSEHYKTAYHNPLAMRPDGGE